MDFLGRLRARLVQTVAVCFLLAVTACTTPGGPEPSPSPSATPGPEVVLGNIVSNARDEAPALLDEPDLPVVELPEPVRQAPAAPGVAAEARDPLGIEVDPRAAGRQGQSEEPQPVAANPRLAWGSVQSQDPAPSPEPSATPAPIQVSKELFNQTFTEVELLINNLNALIKDRNYQKWTAYLSKEYRDRMTQPEYLRQLSQSATLQKNNITLRTLQDYFNYVVVPSRANLRLDDLVFLSETVVEAIMVVGNRRVTVYRLIKIDNQWMIGLS